MSKRKELAMSLLFWSFLLVASAGAFSAGFYYTHEATANIPMKKPVDVSQLPKASPRPSAKPAPSATPTLAPGPLPVSLPPSPATTASEAPVAIATPTEAPTPQPGAPTRVDDTAPAVKTTPNTPPIYRVQVGAFDSREAAQKQVDDLQTQGINAVVVWDGGSYRAQLGAFSDRARALSVADEVNIRGYPVTIRH